MIPRTQRNLPRGLKRRRPVKDFLTRQNWFMNGVGWSIAASLRCWLGTLRVHGDVADDRVDPRRRQARAILTLWHEDLLLLSYFYRHLGIQTIVSDSGDGEIMARGLRFLGCPSIRGSSGRGGGRAALQVLRQQQVGMVAITPDGPLGPRREFQMGAVYLASRTGLPLVPLACGYERPWRNRSWDGLALPRPFTRAVVCSGRELFVPRDADAQVLSEYRERAEAEMHDLSDRAQGLADAWIASGQRPECIGASQTATELNGCEAAVRVGTAAIARAAQEG